MKVEMLQCTQDPEKIIEQAGRTCYKSESNITDESAGKFIRKIIERGHESVLEHASATFRISQVSRAFSHQLVRHRLCSYSQQSQRYVGEDKFGVVEPPSIKKNVIAQDEYLEALRRSAVCYRRLIELGIPKEDARFILPNACYTEIVMSCNFRQLRHLLKLRTDKHAQWEIRAVANEILETMKAIAPNCFADIGGNE